MESVEDRENVTEMERVGNWFKKRGEHLWHEISNEVLEWEGGLKELGRLKTEYAARKDDLKQSIAADDHTVKVRDWLRKKDSLDPSPDDIRGRIMLDDRYSNGADWFLKSGSAESLSFQAFCKSLDTLVITSRSVGRTAIVHDQDADNQEPDYTALKHVLGIRGGLGTGKTTILLSRFYRT